MAEMMAQRAAVDPEFAEDIASLTESKDFIVYPYEATEPIRCESCGTLVAMTPERSVYDREQRPEPAIWEPETGRKHTLRRCDYRRSLSR